MSAPHTYSIRAARTPTHRAMVRLFRLTVLTACVVWPGQGATEPLAPPVPALSLGTLFYSPAERAAVVAARRATDAEGGAAVSLRLDGILTRPQGRYAWINGQRYAHGDALGPGQGRLFIGRQGALIAGRWLKPGERIEHQSDGPDLVRLSSPVQSFTDTRASASASKPVEALGSSGGKGPAPIADASGSPQRKELVR